LNALAPELARLDEVDARVKALAGRDGGVKTRVAGGRVGDLVRAALVRGTSRDRAALVDQIKGLSSVLDGHGLALSIEPRAWLAWTGEALVKNEPEAPASADERPTRAGWQALRGSEQRTPIAYTLAEVALLVSPVVPGASSIASVAALLDGLPAQVRDRAVDLDVGRAERALGYLERWWGDLEKRPVGECVAAGVFDVLWDEAALARITIEARLIEELMPSAADEARKVRARVDALAERVRAGGIGLLEARADEVWRSAMGDA